MDQGKKKLIVKLEVIEPKEDGSIGYMASVPGTIYKAFSTHSLKKALGNLVFLEPNLFNVEFSM